MNRDAGRMDCAPLLAMHQRKARKRAVEPYRPPSFIPRTPLRGAAEKKAVYPPPTGGNIEI